MERSVGKHVRYGVGIDRKIRPATHTVLSVLEVFDLGAMDIDLGGNDREPTREGVKNAQTY